MKSEYLSRYDINALELLERTVAWLNEQHGDLSWGLRSAEDAVKLFIYSWDHPELGEYADDWKSKDLCKALGYNPIVEYQKQFMKGNIA